MVPQYICPNCSSSDIIFNIDTLNDAKCKNCGWHDHISKFDLSKPERILGYHPESDCYIEFNSMLEYATLCQGCEVDDVTGIEHHEKAFKEQMREKNETSI